MVIMFYIKQSTLTIQESVYCTIFSVLSLLQYIVSLTYNKCLYMNMTIALKA